MKVLLIWATATVIVGLLLVLIGKNLPNCTSYRTETQYKVPPSIVVGGGEDGGGIGIPLGNAVPVEVEVCESWE